MRGVLEPLLRERPRELLIVNRTATRAEQLAREFADLVNNDGGALGEVDLEDAWLRLVDGGAGTGAAVHGADLDGDGRRDLWDSLADVIGSVANYLHVHKWDLGAMVTTPASMADLMGSMRLARSIPIKVEMCRSAQYQVWCG